MNSEPPKTVTTVAVTKTFPFSVVHRAYKKGYRHFGENRVEEAEDKIRKARKHGLSGVVWHMVGHVQSRKAKDVARLFDWVDSVDSVKLATKLHREAEVLGKRITVLLEVHLTAEATKSGFDLFGWRSDREKLHRFTADARRICALPNISVAGLMIMPPRVADAEDNRVLFQDARMLSKTIRAQIPGFGKELSMGTSQDYAVAISEGATQVRLGTALLGARP